MRVCRDPKQHEILRPVQIYYVDINDKEKIIYIHIYYNSVGCH